MVGKLFDILIQKYRGGDPAPPREVGSRYKELIDETAGIFTATLRRNEPQAYFRGQKASGVAEEDRDDPARFSLPPSEYAPLGRANLAAHPVFYGGDDPRVVMREIKAKPGEEVFLARWNHPGPIAYVNFTFRLGSTPHVRKLTERMERDIRASTPEDFVDAVFAVASGISRAFLDESYIVSSMLAHHHLYDQEADAIEYASFGGGAGLNYALSPKCAAQLSLHRILLVKVCEDESRYIPLKFGSVSKGKIVWQSVFKGMSPSEYELVNPDEAGARRL